MRPTVRFLSDELAATIIEEGFALLSDPGIRIHNPGALDLLAAAGARVDREAQVAHIPEGLAREALQTAPREFRLYSLDGTPAVRYGGDDVGNQGGILESRGGRLELVLPANGFIVFRRV
jgi:trimethylamine:corrinoid methyltransferase-like protein